MNKYKTELNIQILSFILFLMFFSFPCGIYSQDKKDQWNIYTFGAKGDGITNDTKSIQGAIDACYQAGGGVVILENGTFLSGTIFLRSNVRLHIESGATLLGSLSESDYGDMGYKDPTTQEKYNNGKSLIYSEKQTNIAITGNGVINGNGAQLASDNKVRAHIIHLIKCSNIKVNDVTLKNGSWWIQKYNSCENLFIDRVTVDSKENIDMDRPRYADTPGRNTDGCNIVDSRNVTISNCNIFSGDDGIVLKSFSKDKGCYNVAINNCIISTNASGIKIGTESAGAFKDIVVNNCVVYDTRLGGIELMTVDGADLERVIVSNISLRNIKGTAIYVRLGNRAREYDESKNPQVGTLKDISIKNVYGTGIERYGCSITGIPEAQPENIMLDNINLTFDGGTQPLFFESYPEKPVKELTLENVPEEIKTYPRCDIFGKLPAYGFYIRHVKGIVLRNLNLSYKEKEKRPAIIADDVTHLLIDNLWAQSDIEASSLIRFHNVNQGIVHLSGNLTSTDTFLKISGNQTRSIRSKLNVLRNVKNSILIEKDVNKSEIEYD